MYTKNEIGEEKKKKWWSYVEMVMRFYMAMAVLCQVRIPVALNVILCSVYGLTSAFVVVIFLFMLFSYLFLKKNKEKINMKNPVAKQSATPVLNGVLLGEEFLMFFSFFWGIIKGLDIPSCLYFALFFLLFARVIGMLSYTLLRTCYGMKCPWYSNRDYLLRFAECYGSDKTLQRQYIETIDSMRLIGDITKGELAKERKKIEKYYNAIMFQ